MSEAITPADEELLRRMAGGDEEAFTALYRRQAAVSRFALQMSGSETVAEEVTQEVFLALIREPRRYDARRGTLAAWLYGVARNHVLRQLERGRAPCCSGVAPALSRGARAMRVARVELRGDGGGAGMRGGNRGLPAAPGAGVARRKVAGGGQPGKRGSRKVWGLNENDELLLKRALEGLRRDAGRAAAPERTEALLLGAFRARRRSLPRRPAAERSSRWPTPSRCGPGNRPEWCPSACPGGSHPTGPAGESGAPVRDH